MRRRLFGTAAAFLAAALLATGCAGSKIYSGALTDGQVQTVVADENHNNEVTREVADPVRIEGGFVVYAMHGDPHCQVSTQADRELCPPKAEHTSPYVYVGLDTSDGPTNNEPLGITFGGPVRVMAVATDATKPGFNCTFVGKKDGREQVLTSESIVKLPAAVAAKFKPDKAEPATIPSAGLDWYCGELDFGSSPTPSSTA